MICGTAFTISTMMVGRFLISEIKSCTPACTICGILFISAFTMEPMICGIAATIAVIISGSADTNEVNVVYKRKGNTYGLIEPEY